MTNNTSHSTPCAISTIRGWMGVALLVGALCVPLSAHADEMSVYDTIIQDLETTENGTSGELQLNGFLRDGVYGCGGATYGSVGLQGPTGSHVPVFDAAVHDQMRILTYKECLLDGVLIQMRETLVSYLISSVVKWANQGFNGGSAFPANYNLHMLEDISDPVTEQFLSGSAAQSIPQPFQRDVVTALAQKYSDTTRNAGSGLECPLSATQLQACLAGDWNGCGGREGFNILSSYSSCNKIFAYRNAATKMNETISAAQTQEDKYLGYGSGVQSAKQNETIDLGDGTTVSVERVVTPGFLIAEQLKQIIGTGIRQTENADEIDEMISALMSNIGTEMLTGLNGFSGLSQSVSGQSSYVDRITSDAAARARTSMLGAGGSILDSSIAVETQYKEVRQGSAQTLTQTRLQLESWEYSCWSALIDQAADDLAEQVCSASRSSSGSGLGVGGTGNWCGATVSITPATNALRIRTTTASFGAITVRGQAVSGGATITVIVSDTENNALESVVVQAGSDGAWDAGTFTVTALADGAITVSATETSSRGTNAPVVAIVTKETDAAGDIELFTPVNDPSVSVTVRNGSGAARTQTAVLSPSLVRSRAVTESDITPLLVAIKDSIMRSVKALGVLLRLSALLDDTASVSAQRYILEKVDTLVAQQALHSQAQLRAAQEQADDVESALSNLLSDTKESWESGWCEPTNWNSYAL